MQLESKPMRWLLSLACALFAPLSLAQEYPTKPVRLVVPYSPGGKSDLFGRMIGKGLAARLAVPVIVENRPGAGGNVGTAVVAKAPPDGYTLLVGAPGPISISVSLYQKLPYDPIKNLAPITLAATTPNVLVVYPALSADSVSGLIQHAKAHPGQLNYASAGTGSAGHLATELFRSMAGIEMTHVPYNGASPALTDVISGRASLFITNMPAAMPHVKAGRLRALAVTTASRSSAAPELPTVAETLPGYEADNWVGFLAPAGTPATVLARLHDDIVKTVNSPEVKRILEADGAKVVGSTPSDFASIISREILVWRKIVKQSGARAE